MGSLFELIDAEEAGVRARVEELEVRAAELAERLVVERERLSRLVITRETAGELLARMPVGVPDQPEGEPPTAVKASPFTGAERRVMGILTVPKWQQGMDQGVLPRAYQDILDVVRDAPGPVRAKQIAPRIGLPAETSKIEGVRSKLKRLVERGWLDEDTPGLFTPSHAWTASSSKSP
ncbi:MULTISPECIES: hypothetical protein [unclassified Streptomyces]|uniref:hypothetical protein n=1 Tax=unclassified Streptomyces TaxID=2593676 RepID=UPI002254DDD3|nr:MULTISPECIES: hypothetical protein [unclassified Streptomyces]WSP53175.1 hypothetical protein OG306_01080 [Streptomyces sp. NBC_01241]WSU26083.1 hypothetical protein OG508_37805 [Streptomyces sp. NBC_01108]MCX4799508.1 hypothetical protein [Streptomyces sp. NBC_01242]WSJ40668.1 hypothetical protein OG772_35155 [Streptomyces sp. NBC_01321]WSP65049.1 hypothetical protein OG466_26570 [Streptomyces sp. NBC_01240]